MRNKAICLIGSFASLSLFFGIVCASSATATPNNAPEFEDFPATETFEGTPAKVDFKNNPKAYHYRTRLRTGVAKGPNFAGAYTVVTWGCGSSCAAGAVIDARTGRVQIIPEESITGEIGFRLNSRLLIINVVPSGAGGSDYLPEEKERYFEVEKGKLIPLQP